MSFILKNLREEDFVKVQKNTYQDKRSILSQNLRIAFQAQSPYDSIYLLDFDERYVYFEVYDYEGAGYVVYKVSYTYNGTMATFGTDVKEVVATTQYKDVVPMEKSLLDKVQGMIEKALGLKKIPVVKQFNEEERIVIEPLYILPETVDGQGYTISLEETYEMVKSFNKANEEGILQTSLFHSHKTDSFKILKAWVNECDCTIGGQLVPEGQPLVKLQFINDAAWELRKNGVEKDGEHYELMGVSIYALAREVVEEDA